MGKTLNDHTQKRVIILVLAMLFSVPIMSVSTYITEPDSYDLGLKLLSYHSKHSSDFTETFEAFVTT